MKVFQNVTVEAEVEVNITAEQIVSAIGEETDKLFTVLMGLNNCAKFMKAIPDSVISEMTPSQKELTQKFFSNQSLRFK